jgi:hypothetical protein
VNRRWIIQIAGSQWTQVILGALVLSGISILYGRPFIFHDSGTYLLYGQHIANEIYSGQGSHSLGDVQQDYVGARSPTYSVLLFILGGKISLWAVVAVQAVCASWLLHMTAKHFAAKIIHYIFYAAIVLLAFASSLPYYVAFAMPDVFTGLGSLALILLVTASDRLSRVELVATCILLAAAASFHVTNVVTFTVAAAVGLLTVRKIGLWSQLRSARASAFICFALLVGASVSPIFRQIERDVFRHPVNSPPFLTGRVLEDGPGLSFMRDQCPKGRSFAICAYSPPDDVTADLFLWGKRQDGGFFEYNDADTRRRLIAEQAEFVKEAIFAEPMDQAIASIQNAIGQLVMFSVAEPIEDPRTQSSFPLFEEVHAPTANALPEPVLEVVRSLLAWSSFIILIIIAYLAGTAKNNNPARQVLAVVVIVASVLAVNAALTGAISGPHPRYQARIMWILPAIIVLVGGPMVRTFATRRRFSYLS